MPASLRRAALAGLGLIAASTAAAAASLITVEGLLKDGWEVAGYTGSFDGRSFILFKHKDRSYLVQCSVLYDVLRAERVTINCYEVH